MEANEPDVEKLFAELGIPKGEYDEPSMTERLEGMRTAIGFVRLCDRGDVAGMFRMYQGLSPFEVGTAIGALTQLSLVGCHAMAHMAGLELDGQLVKMERELETAIKDGQG